MGLFGRARLNAEQEARLAALERQVKGLEVEWNEWFDKYRRLYARLVKRVKDDEERAESPPEPRTVNGRVQITNPLARAILGGDRAVLRPER